MPAAAVIPAPLAYIKVVAVKKLVVEFLAGFIGWWPFKAVFFGTFAGYPLPLEIRCFVT